MAAEQLSLLGRVADSSAPFDFSALRRVTLDADSWKHAEPRMSCVFRYVYER